VLAAGRQPVQANYQGYFTTARPVVFKRVSS
jgi:hypothetical protein